MAGKICSVEGCSRQVRAKSYCGIHYARNLRNGTPGPTEKLRIVDHPSICAVDGCSEPHAAKGYCRSHYKRWKRTGDPNWSYDEPTRSGLPQRLWDRLREDENGCWVYTGHLTSQGYGSISISNQHVYVHRAVYAAVVEPLDRSMEIDHKCRNRACANPDHLQQVPRALNAQNFSGPNPSSKSGVRGVWLNTRTGKWCGQVKLNGRRRSITPQPTLERAAAAILMLRNSLHTNNLLDRQES